MYADTMTRSMQEAISETNRRRLKQDQYNKEHGIIPKTIVKKVSNILEVTVKLDDEMEQKKLKKSEKDKLIKQLEKNMKEAAAMLEFELAAEIRDRIIKLKGN